MEQMKLDEVHATVPTVDVIVVTYNHKRFIKPLMEGLRMTDYPKDRFTVYIVDNCSTDGTREELKRFIDQPEDSMPRIQLYESESNLGFAGGNNFILKNSQATYAYLLNPDAAFNEQTLSEIVHAAEEHPNAGAFQSLLVLMQDPGTINSVGNDIHFAGHGYCRGYKDPIRRAPAGSVTIAYASGAGVLYRMSTLHQVGYFDEMLFAYHEDLELGWRMLIAGSDSLLIPSSVLKHHFEFSRSIKKWYFMERNRLIVVLSLYKIGTIMLLLPALIAIEAMTWLFAFLGGWWKEKGRAIGWFFRADAWKYIAHKRAEVKRLRKRSDREVLSHFVSTIAHQETDSWFMKHVANPLMTAYGFMLNILVRW